jgi:LysW-gamma-L-lysine/LysW-L-ornithine aminotransferase
MDYSRMQSDYIAPTYGMRGPVIIRGEGAYLYDDQGNRYLDLFSNYGVNILGHNNSAINHAISSQLAILTNLHGSFANDKRSMFGKRLCEISRMDKVFFCNSGAEAIEATIKFARLKTGRTEIISANMGYHGKTMGALSLTKTLKKYNDPFLPLLSDVKHFSFGDAGSLRQVISDRTSAVFLEPIQGESGVRLADMGFFKEVRQICDDAGALLVIDEIQTGMGRTGKLLAIDHYGIKADMICMAKGLAAGLPVGAVMMTDAVSEKLFSGSHTNTFGGNPLVSAAGIATLDYIDENGLLKKAEGLGDYFVQEIKNLKSPIIREVRGAGLMIGIELKVKCSDYTKSLQDKGIIVIPTGANVLRLLPPLIISKEQIDSALGIFREVLV